jgi:hypothetical protein
VRLTARHQHQRLRPGRFRAAAGQLVQDDGVHQPVAQAFEPELLDWSEFSVPVRHDQVPELPSP